MCSLRISRHVIEDRGLSSGEKRFQCASVRISRHVLEDRGLSSGFGMQVYVYLGM